MWKIKILILIAVSLTGISIYLYSDRSSTSPSFLENLPSELIWNSDRAKAFYYAGVERKISFNFELNQPWPYSEVYFADWDINIPSKIFISNSKGVFSYDFATNTHTNLLANENILNFLPLQAYLIVLSGNELVSINLSTMNTTLLLALDLPEIPGHGPPLNLTKVSESTFLLEIPDEYFMLTGDKKYYLGNATEIKPYQVETLSIN